MAYLYGSSIQGIQSFIFETNKLKEIVGASEIVEQLSEKIFKEAFSVQEDNFITHAAGNIKLVSDDDNLIKRIVKEWPKMVEESAPGLTLSQAVVKFEEELSKEDVDSLEEKLKVARNKSIVTQQLSPMGAIRSRRTGRSGVDWEDNSRKKNGKNPRDCSSKLKQKSGLKNAPLELMAKSLSDNNYKDGKFYPFDVSEMLFEDDDTGWLAVIHADGNSLGKMIQGMAEELQKSNNYDIKDAFKKFSNALDNSTINATKYAVDQIVIPAYEKSAKETKKILPFRPVIIGGDDLTVIIRADLALDFTEKYLEKFQSQTKDNLTDLVKDFKLTDFTNGLTACAGIAYMKASYPFYYAVNLAESLCSNAKNRSKEIDSTNVPASIAFHKIQDSFVEEYQEIIDRELSPKYGPSFKFGPYGIDNAKLPSVSNLREQVKSVLNKEAPKSGIRKWLSLLHSDENKAELWLERIKDIAKENHINDLNLNEAIKDGKTHLYDLLAIASICRVEGEQ